VLLTSRISTRRHSHAHNLHHIGFLWATIDLIHQSLSFPYTALNVADAEHLVPCRRRTPSHVVGRRARHPVVQLRRPCVLAVAAQKCPAALFASRVGHRDSVFYGGDVVYSRFEGKLPPTDSRAVARGHLMVVDIHRNLIRTLFAGG
jgi:hypothetical protein